MGNLATSVPCATTWRGWKNVGQREPRSPRTIHQSEALLSLRAKSVGIMGLRSEGDDWHAAGMDPMELIEVMELVRGVGGQRSAGCGAPHRSCTEASAAPSGAGFVLLRTAGSREPGADSLHPPLQPFAPPGRGRGAGSYTCWPWCEPSAISSTIFALKASRSAGLRLVTRP